MRESPEGVGAGATGGATGGSVGKTGALVGGKGGFVGIDGGDVGIGSGVRVVGIGALSPSGNTVTMRDIPKDSHRSPISFAKKIVFPPGAPSSGLNVYSVGLLFPTAIRPV